MTKAMREQQPAKIKPKSKPQNFTQSSLRAQSSQSRGMHGILAASEFLLFCWQVLFFDGRDHDVVGVHHFGEVDFANLGKQFVGVEV
jgi:hypothetical protein